MAQGSQTTITTSDNTGFSAPYSHSIRNLRNYALGSATTITTSNNSSFSAAFSHSITSIRNESVGLTTTITTNTNTSFSSPFSHTIFIVPDERLGTTINITTNNNDSFSAPFSHDIDTSFDVVSYKIFKKALNRAHKAEIAESDGIVLSIIKRETPGIGALYGRFDAVTTSVDFGTGSATTDITIGNTTADISFQGDLTILGSIGSIDDLILINSFSSTGSNSGFAIERGSSGDDSIFFWDETNNRFELGFFDTNSGLLAPTSALTTLSDLKINNLLLGSLTISADSALAITATGATSDLFFGGRGSSIALNELGETSLTGFTETTIIGALNELKSSGISSVSFVSNEYTNGEISAITIGQLVYISAINTVSLASSASNNNLARSIGAVAEATIASSSSGSIYSEGIASVRFEESLSLSASDEVFLSALTAGSATNIRPSGSGNIVKSIGVIKNIGSYDGGANLIATVHLIPGPPEIVV